jgi:hypothetical protein
MKSTFAQFVSFASKIDRRYLQLTYFVLLIVASVIMQRPSDGGTGPF